MPLPSGLEPGDLPRALSPHLLWSGRCAPVEYKGQAAHSHVSTYLVKGSRKSILIDTGLTMAWPQIERDVEEFLDGRPLDYVFPTHTEYPHGALLPKWMEKYPNAIAVGDLRDQVLYYPHLADRLRMVAPGDCIDLGDREIAFIPALWKDLANTLWAFETVDRVLFVSDGFAFLHLHQGNECSLLTSEQPEVEVEMMRFVNERALAWTRFVDARKSFPELDRLLTMLDPRLIAPCHGAVVDTLESVVPRAKEGMAVYRPQ